MLSFREFLSSTKSRFNPIMFVLKNYRAVREAMEILNDLEKNGSAEDKIRFAMWHLALLSGKLKLKKDSGPINKTFTKAYSRRFPF